MRLHFISGLPRSGSTLLAAILRQNPRAQASMSSPVFSLFNGLRLGLSQYNEFAFRVSDEQRIRVLRSIVEAFYHVPEDSNLVFDTSRGWTSVLSALALTFPRAKVICCVRNLAWILDSFERQVQRNALQIPKMFGKESATREVSAETTVVERVQDLMKKQVGGPLNCLRQAWFGEDTGRLVVIRYETMVDQPAYVMKRLYEILDEPDFPHDFDSLEYDEPEFDARLGMPGLHFVRARVEAISRETILPADLFGQHNRAFWEMPGQNPRGVCVL